MLKSKTLPTPEMETGTERDGEDGDGGDGVHRKEMVYGGAETEGKRWAAAREEEETKNGWGGLARALGFNLKKIIIIIIYIYITFNNYNK